MLADFPDNWWQQRVTCQTLGEWFGHHLVGLFFSVEIEGKKQQALYTGLVLLYENSLLWITAGHAIDEIRSILSDSKIKIEIMRWLDGYVLEGAESIPVHNRKLNMFSATEFGIDFGAIMISGLDANNMMRNDRVQLITERIWKNLSSAKPEGYYIVGYPKEWTEYHETRLIDNRTFNSFRANIACLPVRQIEYRGDSHSHK